MELLQLKYFKTVAEIGKISEAADTLFVSSSALSTSISRLERELGVQLFDRTNNRIILNEQGQIFLRHVKQVFASLEDAKAELRQNMLQQGPHISVVDVNSTTWVDMIMAFTSEYPQFTLSWKGIALSDLAANGLPVQCNFLLADETDIPVAYREELESAYLFETKPMVMLHPEHPLANEKQISAEMLEKEKIFLPMQEFPLYERVAALFRAANVPLSGGNQYPFLARVRMVANNLGISFVLSNSRRVIHEDLRYIPLKDSFEPWITRLYWRKNHKLTEEECVFKEFTESYVRKLY